MIWKERRRSFFSAIVGATLLFLFIGLIGTGNVSAFFLNLGTDGIAALVTIFIVDKIVEDYKNETSAGARFVAYREACWINNRLLAFWEELLAHSMLPGTKIDSPFSRESIATINQFLNLHGDAPVYPAMQWIDYIPYFGAKQTKEIENILSRYASHLPATVIESLSNIEHAFFFKMIINHFQDRSGSRTINTFQTNVFSELANDMILLNTGLLEMDKEFAGRTHHIVPRKLDDGYSALISAKASGSSRVA